MKAKLAQRPPARLAVQSRRPPERRPRDTRPPALDLHVVAGGLDASGVLRLQAAAGNQAVGQLLAQRAGEAAARPPLGVQAQAVDCPPAPPPLIPRTPEDSPRFQAVTGRVETEAGKLKSHPPARAKVAEAEQGAAGPANEVRSQAAKAQVDQMGQQKPKGFDKVAFIASVHAAIDRATPKTMTEVDDFTSSGKPGQLKEQVVGQVGEGKEAAGKGIKDATKAAPDLSKGSPKPVTPMKPEAPGPAPRNVGAAEATPLPLPAEQVSLQHGKCETSNQLAEAEVTEEQVADSNEPQFQDAMASKKEADQHAETAPGQFREGEQATLDAAKGEAAQSAAGAMSQAHHSRTSGLGHVGSHKNDAKSKNEAERARVAREIEAIYGKTKADVEQTLNDLDGKVTKAFDDGEKGARDAFEGYYKTKKDAYFDDRYSGFWGWKRWLRDKIKGAPPEVNGFIVEAKNLYVSQMNQVIDRVATIVETELNRATARIQQGRDQITEYVAQQPKNLRRVAEEAGKKFASQFDDLDQSVMAKSGSLVEGLAQQYVAAAKKVDERCEEMREENKGLIDKIKDKIAGMIEAIKQMKELLSQIADRAAAVAGQIIRHPIRFLENLVDAVKQGFDLFTNNIEKHLKEGVISWLFGEVAKAGITLPADFDLKGIITLIAQLLGLGWDAIRARAVAILGPKVVSLIEKGEAGVEKAGEVFNIIKTEGLGGVAHLMADKVGEVKDQALDFVKGMVITEVITAGVKWVLSLFNPVGAFIKACKAIYDIVMFFVHHASEIVDLVNSILDNLAAIVAGNIAAAAKLVEDSLAKAIPLVIGFLASLLGLGDFGGKIRGVIDKVRQPVNEAIDWVLGKVVKPMVGFVGKGASWAMGKAKAGAAWVKGKAQQGVAWVKGKGQKGVAWAEDKSGRAAQTLAPGPTVAVAFEMAGTSHRLVFKPVGDDVSVTMASGTPLPLAQRFEEAYNRIEFFRAYVESIEDERVKARFRAELLPKIEKVETVDVEKYKKVYKEVYPRRTEEELGRSQQQEQVARTGIGSLVNSTEALLNEIKQWAGTTRIHDLRADAIDNAIDVKGKRIWEEEYERIKAEIDEILSDSALHYKGRPLQYVGSLTRGSRGPHKGRTAFNLRDFDVDLFVVDRNEFDRVKRKPSRDPRDDEDKIFPTPRNAPELAELQARVRAALVQRFKGVKGIRESQLVLRRVRP
ncbi:hypothetical protein [Candidatus Nephthysia bennettiae]|uniref:Uncharacterized protein n=1 Tax=Candidatus Nephthysia bennettiae TaxID=3127016 RepID=A0A934JZP8_9BACT|nr:hypothetical protein [Candidatus Dormibacteraeota bacterium]MBJ7614790.1 hypothetical protein [Candidatus Dormibacteraeota bacterium]